MNPETFELKLNKEEDFDKFINNMNSLNSSLIEKNNESFIFKQMEDLDKFALKKLKENQIIN